MTHQASPCEFDLLTTVEQGGCSAKLPAQLLESLVQGLPKRDDPRLIVGTDTHDDAAVWKISDDEALIFTTDFFPPMCSSPYEFGEIAAANALSDVYAMGGTPRLALNLVMFPSSKIDVGVLREILAGGAAKTAEAGAVLAGGHTIDDAPPKFGLAVIGFVHPERVTSNARARVGDKIILTKPLGTGVILAAQKLGLASPALLRAALDSMKTLNRLASEIMTRQGVLSATDITGFGCLGHALRMAEASGVTLEIHARALPVFEGVDALLAEGCVPGAAFRNLSFVEKDVSFDPALPWERRMLLCDAQTSGGLFFCVAPDRAQETLRLLREAGITGACEVGVVRPPSATKVAVTFS